MIISEEFNLHVLDLFKHEGYDCGPFDLFWIAEQLSEELAALVGDEWMEIHILSPAECNLDRFIIKAQKWTDDLPTTYADRVQSEEEAKKLWPPDIFDAIMELEKRP